MQYGNWIITFFSCVVILSSPNAESARANGSSSCSMGSDGHWHCPQGTTLSPPSSMILDCTGCDDANSVRPYIVTLRGAGGGGYSGAGYACDAPTTTCPISMQGGWTRDGLNNSTTCRTSSNQDTNKKSWTYNCHQPSCWASSNSEKGYLCSNVWGKKLRCVSTIMDASLQLTYKGNVLYQTTQLTTGESSQNCAQLYTLYKSQQN